MENIKNWFLQTSSQIQHHNTISEKLFQKELSKNKSHKNFGIKLDRLPENKNHGDMKVISPFYDRNKICKKENCKCPYHRKMRYMEVKKIDYRRKDGWYTAEQSPKQLKSIQNSNQKPRNSLRSSVPDHSECSKQNRSKKNKKLHFQVQSKISNSNEEFEQFLRENELKILKKMKYTQKDLHVIKKSVGEIFTYLYNNLDKPVEDIRSYLDNLVKDREMTELYLERFKEMKERKYGPGSCSNRKNKTEIYKGKKMTTFDLNRKKKNKYMSQFAIGRISPENRSEKGNDSTAKSVKSQKLWMELMINNIECGKEVSQKLLIKLEEEELQNFTQNLGYLKKAVPNIKENTIVKLKDNVLSKLKSRYEVHKRPTEQITTKKVEVIRAIHFLNTKLDELSFERSNSKYTVASKQSQKTIRSKNGSIRSKRNEMLINTPHKSNFLNQDSYRYADKKEQNDDRAIRPGDKSRTIFGNNNIAQPFQKKKKQKAPIAKYRRLSHDAFQHNTFLQDQSDYKETIKNLRLSELEQIDDHLDTLAQFVLRKMTTIKQNQSKIMTGMNVKTMIASDNDSLLTVKRKARAFKDLLKEEIPKQIKGDIKEYVNYLDQRNFTKNRKWAFQVFKNLLVNQNQIQIPQIEVKQQSFTQHIHECLKGIFPTPSKLIYYNLSHTKYVEGQFNFENNIFDFIKNNQQKSLKRKQTLLERKRTLFELKSLNLDEKEEEKKDDDLVQIGLKHKCKSNCFGLDEDEMQNYEKEPSSIEWDKPPKRLEDTYFKLFQKLQNL